MAEIEMPNLGESVTEGTVTRWFKQIGDTVAMDEALFEVSTDKVDSEVPSPVAGFLTEIRVAEGDTVDVGTVLAVVSDEAPAAAPPAPPAPEPVADATPAPPVASAAEPPAPAAPPAPAPRPVPAGPTADDASVLVSPVLRTLLDDAGVPVSRVRGTGPGGRITRADVDAALAHAPRRGAAPAGLPAIPPPPSGALRRPRPRQSSGGDTVEPLNRIRRITGEHMVRSKQTSAHVLTVIEVDYENVERVRRAHGESWRAEEGFGLTYLPFVSRAVVDALRDFPHVNATVGDGELVVHNYVDLAIAVDLDFEGLLMPVIHDADDRRLRALAREIDDLADRSRDHELVPDEITGGTFTITNNGSFGTFMVAPVINQPQVATLSLDGVSRKPVVVTAADGTEAVAIHSVGMLALSWDQRAFDGAYAAAFMAEVKLLLETRDWEAEL